MGEAAQHSLASWIPADVLVGFVALLLGVIWWTWRREQQHQVQVIDKLAVAVAELNLRLTGVVSVPDFRSSMGAVHDKINTLQQRVAVLEDRSSR